MVTKAGDFTFDGVCEVCSIFQFRAIGVTSDWVRVRVDDFSRKCDWYTMVLVVFSGRLVRLRCRLTSGEE